MSNIVKYFFDQVIARERVVALREELRASLKSGGLRINRLLDLAPLPIDPTSGRV